jgi:hypothetical protein
VKWDPELFNRCWSTVSTKFVQDGDRLLNERLEEHRQKSKDISAKNSGAGRKGAESRWRKDGERHEGEPVASAIGGDSERHKSANGVTNGNPSHPILKSKNSPENSPQDPTVTASPRARARLAGDEREVFERIQQRYPAGLHRGDHWLKAERAVYRLLEQGVTEQQLVDAVDGYAAQQLELQNTGTERVKRPDGFFESSAWRGPFPLPKRATAGRVRTATDIAEEAERAAAAQ